MALSQSQYRRYGSNLPGWKSAFVGLDTRQFLPASFVSCFPAPWRPFLVTEPSNNPKTMVVNSDDPLLYHPVSISLFEKRYVKTKK